MPYIIRPRSVYESLSALLAGNRRWVQIFVSTLVAAGMALGTSPALAEAGCPHKSATHRFEALGDTALYVLVEGGTFESGAPGWSLENAEVANEEGAEGSPYSLTIAPGGTAVSPPMCVSNEYPSFRFFVRQVSGNGTLSVALHWRDVFGFPHNTRVGSLDPGTGWELSPAMDLASKLPLWMPGNSLKVSLAFESSRGMGFGEDQEGGTFAIDDVYVDPYSR